MDDVKLTWHDRKGIHGDGDLVTRSECYLPDPFTEGRLNRVLIAISREEEDGQESRYRLMLKQATGPGYRSRTFPTVEAAKQAAEELAAGQAKALEEATAARMSTQGSGNRAIAS